jgi:hypothetical protein
MAVQAGFVTMVFEACYHDVNAATSVCQHSQKLLGALLEGSE